MWSWEPLITHIALWWAQMAQFLMANPVKKFKKIFMQKWSFWWVLSTFRLDLASKIEQLEPTRGLYG